MTGTCYILAPLHHHLRYTQYTKKMFDIDNFDTLKAFFKIEYKERKRSKNVVVVVGVGNPNPEKKKERTRERNRNK